MPIKYETNDKWGTTFYLKDDPEQLPHSLVGILLLPGKPKLQLSHQGEVCEVYECETAREPDLVKKFSAGSASEDDDE